MIFERSYSIDGTILEKKKETDRFVLKWEHNRWACGSNFYLFSASDLSFFICNLGLSAVFYPCPPTYPSQTGSKYACLTLFVCLFVCHSICWLDCLFACLSLCLCLCLSFYLSVSLPAFLSLLTFFSRFQYLPQTNAKIPEI